MQQHMQMQQMQMQPEMQTQMQTGMPAPLGNPIDYPVDAQGMQLDDPEAPLDVDGVTEESIQEFIDNLMQELPNEVVLQLSDSGGSPDNA